MRFQFLNKSFIRFESEERKKKPQKKHFRIKYGSIVLWNFAGFFSVSGWTKFSKNEQRTKVEEEEHFKRKWYTSCYCCAHSVRRFIGHNFCVHLIHVVRILFFPLVLDYRLNARNQVLYLFWRVFIAELLWSFSKKKLKNSVKKNQKKKMWKFNLERLRLMEQSFFQSAIK